MGCKKLAERLVHWSNTMHIANRCVCDFTGTLAGALQLTACVDGHAQFGEVHDRHTQPQKHVGHQTYRYWCSKMSVLHMRRFRGTAPSTPQPGLLTFYVFARADKHHSLRRSTSLCDYMHQYCLMCSSGAQCEWGGACWPCRAAPGTILYIDIAAAPICCTFTTHATNSDVV